MDRVDDETVVGMHRYEVAVVLSEVSEPVRVRTLADAASHVERHPADAFGEELGLHMILRVGDSVQGISGSGRFRPSTGEGARRDPIASQDGNDEIGKPAAIGFPDLADMGNLSIHLSFVEVVEIPGNGEEDALCKGDLPFFLRIPDQLHFAKPGLEFFRLEVVDFARLGKSLPIGEGRSRIRADGLRGFHEMARVKFAADHESDRTFPRTGGVGLGSRSPHQSPIRALVRDTLTVGEQVRLHVLAVDSGRAGREPDPLLGLEGGVVDLQFVASADLL